MAQVTLIHKDGSQVQAWPVDVAELLRGGEYKLAPGETFEPPLDTIADLVRSGRYKLVPVDTAPEAAIKDYSGGIQNPAVLHPATSPDTPVTHEVPATSTPRTTAPTVPRRTQAPQPGMPHQGGATVSGTPASHEISQKDGSADPQRERTPERE